MSGRASIPPTDWNSPEMALWHVRHWTQRLGHEVYLINTPNPAEVLADITEIEPEVVHIHYAPYFPMTRGLHVPLTVIGSQDPRVYGADTLSRTRHWWDNESAVCCASAAVARRLATLGVAEHRLFVVPNGARSDLIRYSPHPRLPAKSLCLGVINRSKRQALLKGIASVDVVGPIRPTKAEAGQPDYGPAESNYRGAWTHEEANRAMSDYANLVCLSSREVAPTVACEALMAGLGLVVSEAAAANLDRDREFISVISEDRMPDHSYLEDEIAKNRERSLGRRDEIRAYALENLEWRRLVELYLEETSARLAARRLGSAYRRGSAPRTENIVQLAGDRRNGTSNWPEKKRPPASEAC